MEKEFKPIVGMEPQTKNGNGFNGKIEYVGKDYFILRSYRTGLPVLVNTYQYHNFKDYKIKKADV